MARVMKFKQPWKALRFETEGKYALVVKMPTHDIYFCLMGSIEGTSLPFGRNWEAIYTGVLNEMAEFYRKTRITNNPYQFKKYVTDYQERADSQNRQ
jgi:hypothetical protein